MITRIYTGADGLSHAEQIELKAANGVTELMKATGAQFSSRPAPPATGTSGRRVSSLSR